MCSSANTAIPTYMCDCRGLPHEVRPCLHIATHSCSQLPVATGPYKLEAICINLLLNRDIISHISAGACAQVR